MTHPLTIPAVGAVALASIGLTALAVRAYRRSGNPNLRFVVAAFGIFALKGILATAALYNHSVDHEDLELLLSLFDLAALAILLLPFVRRR